VIGEFIFEVIAEVIVQGILSFIDYPGAYIHWHLRENRFSFKEIRDRYFGINLLISCVLYAVIVGIFI